MENRVILTTENDTKRYAESLARKLRGGETIGLIGDLGAGKTTLTHYLAAALGVQTAVTSPTYAIMQLYATPHAAIKHFVHIDAYRLTSAEELAGLGVEEYCRDPHTVTVVEWADRVTDILPPNTIFLHITFGKTQRTIRRHQ